MKKLIVSIAGCVVLAVSSATGAGSLAVDVVIRLEGAPADGTWEQRDAQLAIQVQQVTPGVFDAQVESLGGEARQSLHTRVKIGPGGKALLGGLLNRKISLARRPNLRLKSSAGLPLEMLGANSTNTAIAALFKVIMTGGKVP